MVLSQVQKQWHCLLKVWITVHIMLQCVSFRALGWISRSWICEAFWFEFGRFAKLHYCWHRLFEASYFPKFGIPVNVLYFGVTPDFLVHLSLLQEQSQVGIIFRKTAQVSLKHFLVHKSKLKGPLYPVISTVWGNSEVSLVYRCWNLCSMKLDVISCFVILRSRLILMSRGSLEPEPLSLQQLAREEINQALDG